MSFRRGNTRSAADWSTCFRWARNCLTGSTSSATKSRASRPSTSTRNARCIRCRRSGCCRRVSSRLTTKGARASASVSARSSRAIRPSRASTRTSRPVSHRLESNTGCRCFLKRRRRCSTICPGTRRSACTTTCPRRSAISGVMRRRATTCSRARKRGRCYRPTNFFSLRNRSSPPPSPTRGSFWPRAVTARRRQFHPSPSTAVPTTRWRS